MEKEIIYIGLEFLFGPIQKFEEDENGNPITGIGVVDGDSLVQNLDALINELWCSLYSENENSPSGVDFDSIKEKEIAPQLLSLLNQLIDRLNEINDGSFEIEDMITERLKTLL